MIYISINYYLLVLIVLVAYYLFPINHRWVVLLAGNVCFYLLLYRTGWWIFTITITISFAAGIALTVFEGKLKKWILILSILATAMPWLLVKNLSYILEISAKNPIYFITPLGISFYTLQMISYLVDVYNQKTIPERNFARFALFASFFPQLIQGPIPRYGQLQNQLITGHRFDERNVVKGFCYVIWGFFLKLMIADKAGVIVNTVFDNYPAYSGGYIWVASILYSVQLYADFLACTTLAQGVSKMFGINLAGNFAQPYFAASIRDFWRRWHISLSSWLKDYIYIPLGGNRSGSIKKYWNLFATFLFSGLWHGAGYKFLIWGGMHAAYQIIGELSQNTQEIIYRRLNISPNSKKALKQIGTFLLVNWAWIIFRADTFQTGFRMIVDMFTVFTPWIYFNDSLFLLGLGWKEIIVLLFSIGLLWKVDVYNEKGKPVSDKIMEQSLVIRWGVFIAAIIGIMVFGTYGFGFDAQNFIYGGF